MPSRPKTKDGKDSESGWLVNLEFLEMQAMTKWGVTPKQWRSHCKDDRVKMLAYCRVTSRMESADNDVINKKMDKSRAAAQNTNSKRGIKPWAKK